MARTSKRTRDPCRSGIKAMNKESRLQRSALQEEWNCLEIILLRTKNVGFPCTFTPPMEWKMSQWRRDSFKIPRHMTLRRDAWEVLRRRPSRHILRRWRCKRDFPLSLRPFDQPLESREPEHERPASRIFTRPAQPFIPFIPHLCYARQDQSRHEHRQRD